MEKVTRDNLVTHLVTVQLKMIGKTIDDVKDDAQWFHNNTLTVEQIADFNVYALPVIKKAYKCNSNRAKRILAEFELGWGLRVSPSEIERREIVNKLKEQ